MPLHCKHCGNHSFRLRRAKGGAEAECIQCGRVIPNSALRAATKQPIQSEAADEDEQP